MQYFGRKTEEAKEWGMGTGPGRGTESEMGRKGSPGPGCRTGLTVLPLLLQA